MDPALTPAGYILCGTPRSGSTLLCGLLAATGRTGVPDSFFRRQIIGWWAGEWGVPHPHPEGERAFRRAYLAAAIRAGRGGTPVFGLRLMQENRAELLAFLDDLFPGLPSDRARLEAAFGPLIFLHLSRADTLAQAVSLVKAEQTGLWHMAPDGTEVERVAPPALPEYDFARLDAAVRALERDAAAWEGWFAAEGIAPLRVTYDDLSADPAATLARVCAALGVAAPEPGTIRPGLARLSDGVSAEWAHRYRREAGLAGGA